MRRKIAALLVALCLLGTLPGCLTGPYRFSRAWDDYYNQKYTENVWLHGVLLGNVLLFYPIVHGALGVFDIIVVNPIAFWSSDAWDNRGMGFDHEPLQGATKSTSTFM
jgi:hypothetical protein